jgi:hypothetical protein
MTCIPRRLRSYNQGMARVLLMLGIVAIAPAARAQTAGLDDARLGASAAEVHAIVSRAGRDHLPDWLLIDKVNEGLAKGVPPARIAIVLRGLAENLGRARDEARPFVAGEAPHGLLKALVEAHVAGVGGGDAGVVLGAGGRERAIEVLTDLVQRGYPASAAARVVGDLSHREAPLEQLVGEAEKLRSIDGATAVEALDAVARANAQGLGLDHAEQLLHHGEAGENNGRGPNRETSGARGPKSGGVAAPGHGKGKP